MDHEIERIRICVVSHDEHRTGGVRGRDTEVPLLPSASMQQCYKTCSIQDCIRKHEWIKEIWGSRHTLIQGPPPPYPGSMKNRTAGHWAFHTILLHLAALSYLAVCQLEFYKSSWATDRIWNFWWPLLLVVTAWHPPVRANRSRGRELLDKEQRRDGTRMGKTHLGRGNRGDWLRSQICKGSQVSLLSQLQIHTIVGWLLIYRKNRGLYLPALGNRVTLLPDLKYLF